LTDARALLFPPVVARIFACCAALIAFACACGGARLDARRALHDATRALENGRLCDPGEQPSVVSVIGTNESETQSLPYCTGTLIAPDAVLLAAHCFTETESVVRHVSLETDLVFLETADVDTMNAFLAASFTVRAEHALASYDGGSHDNDIALLFLDEPILDRALAILPTDDEDAQLATGTPVGMVGYGYDENDVLGAKRCGANELSDASSIKLFTAGDPQGCNGDSGGPLFADVDTAHARADRIVGVASYTAPDCSDFTGYTRVAAYRDSFVAPLLEDCSARAWCDVPGVIPASYFDPPPTEGEGEGEGQQLEADADPSVNTRAVGCTQSGAPAWGVALLAAARRRLKFRV
jgi:secreted trypsin-like serine protease